MRRRQNDVNRSAIYSKFSKAWAVECDAFKVRTHHSSTARTVQNWIPVWRLQKTRIPWQLISMWGGTDQ